MEKEYDYSDANLIYTVSELTLLLKETIETKFYAVWVKGELSALKNNYASGHFYFDLKDENVDAKISCIIFKYDIKRIRFEIQEGILVRAFGRINLYEPRGSYSFIITDLEPEGYGQFALAFEQLKAKLEKEGLFEESRKRKIPFLPKTIGIVTSRSGAVLHDIIKIIVSRFENIHIIFINATVQGPNSSKEIADAINILNYHSKENCKIDVMIVGRGGGSIEDLWAFNEEITAYAIFNSKIPVISAIGHETDFVIADFVSDMRASTPSNAAEIVVPVKFDLINKVRGLKERLESAVFNEINKLKLALKNLLNRQKIKTPLVLIQNKYRIIDDLTYDLSRSIKLNIKTIKAIIKNQNEKLNNIINLKLSKYKNSLNLPSKALYSLSPYAVLKRGYSIVFSQKKEIVSKVSKVKKNENVTIVVSDGSIDALVLSKSKNKTNI